MIKLDLRTDLAKVTTDTLGRLGDCRYTAPCAIGAMMTPEEREFLRSDDFIRIMGLVNVDKVSIPEDQHPDFMALQHAFDTGDSDPEHFHNTLKRLKEKYDA